MERDIIVIGSGLGGLVAGAKLAKEGKKVLLIEQHYVVGGCATTFKRKDFTIEVGLHEMDGLDEADLKRKIFDELGVFDEIEFARIPEFYRFTNGRVDIVIPDNSDKAIKILKEKFPEEEKGIKKFFKVILSLKKELNRFPGKGWQQKLLLPIFPILYPNVFQNVNRTLGDFLDSIIDNEDLKMTLMANIGYYHDDPHTMSMLFFSMAQSSYFSGGYYIKGGSQKFSDYLAKIIVDNGGKIILGHIVTEIITKEGKAIGVKYNKAIGRSNEEQKSFAKAIIANVAIPNVVNDLLPSIRDHKLKEQVKKMKPACSLLSIYLCFKRSLKELGNKYYSTFVFDESVEKLSQFIENMKDPDFTNKGYVFVDYGQIDSDLAPKNKSLGVIVTIDYLSNWEDLSEKEYKTKKEETAQIFIGRLERLIPGIKEEIEYYEVGTPKTIERYTKNLKGSVYGFAQIPNQAGIKRIDHKSSIDNLFYASAWTRPGGGFTGAIISGYNCAKKILEVN